MKKKILILLTIITLILLGIWLYMTNEEVKYNEKYDLSNYKQETENINKKEIDIVIDESTGEEVKIINGMKQIPNIELRRQSGEIITELEDLNVEGYTVYNLITEEEKEKERLKEIELFLYNSDLKPLKVKSVGEFKLTDANTEDFVVYNMTYFFNEAGNLFGTIYIEDAEYTTENITKRYQRYKEIDLELYDGRLAYHNYGEPQETQYKNMEGIYNVFEYTYVGMEKGYNPPTKYRYLAHYNYYGKIISVCFETYKNCTYGQLEYEELLDKIIDFE